MIGFERSNAVYKYTHKCLKKMRPPSLDLRR
jgi:hypothetical protein